MGINATATGFVINDATGPPNLGLTVENSQTDDFTAAELGLTGFVGAQLVGGDLAPQASFEIDETTGTTAADLGIDGIFNYSRGGTDVDPLLSLTSNVADLRNGIEFDGSSFVMWQGENSYTVDLADPATVTIQDLLDDINNSPLNVTASLNSSGRGIQIVNNDANRSFTIGEVDGGRMAKQMDIFGSSDIMGSMLVLAESLRTNDHEGINRMLFNLDESMTSSLATRASLGTNALRLESTASRLLDKELTYTRLLSEVEDADLTQVITDLASRENSYQAALMAAAKIIQPSLLDFLR
jgi:flagellin-like hook-associated protein FlgL